MNTALFVTVGTSLLYQANVAENVIKAMQLEPLSRVDSSYTHYSALLATPFAPRGKSCAEVATISALAREKKLNPAECVVFLFPSDTLPSLLCAFAIRDHLSSSSNDYAVDIVPSTGFHLNDSKSFASVGIATLLRNISEKLIAAPFSLLKPRYIHRQNYLVISGGYKGSLIYLTFFSQIVGVDLVYQFEKENDYPGNPPLLIIPKGPFALALPFTFKLYAQENGGTPSFNSVETVIKDAIGAKLKTKIEGTATEYIVAKAIEKELKEASTGSEVFGGDTFKGTVYHGDSIDLYDNSGASDSDKLTDIDILLSRHSEVGESTGIVISVKGNKKFLETEFTLAGGQKTRLDHNLVKKVPESQNIFSLDRTVATETKIREKVSQLTGSTNYEFWYFIYQYDSSWTHPTKLAIQRSYSDAICGFEVNCRTLRDEVPAYCRVTFRLFFVQMNPELLARIAHDESNFFDLIGTHTLCDYQSHSPTDLLSLKKTFFFELATSPSQEA